MKEEIKLWIEFKEDQDIRMKAKNDDPETNMALVNALEGDYLTSSHIYKYSMLSLDIKYGIVTKDYENFMNWLADGQPKFKGVEIKHEVKQ